MTIRTYLHLFLRPYSVSRPTPDSPGGNLDHAAGLGYVVEGGLKERRIAGLGHRVEVRDGVLIALDVFAGIEFANVRHKHFLRLF